MAVIGIQIDRTNPEYKIEDFLFWKPQFTNFISSDLGCKYFHKLVDIAQNKIFKSIFGSDWELAMSDCIAHYLTLIAQQMQAPAGDSLQSIAGGGTMKGVLSSMSVGGFSKSYELGLTTIESDESKFWNQTSYGVALMALYKTKSVPSIFVVTNGYIPGAN